MDATAGTISDPNQPALSSDIEVYQSVSRAAVASLVLGLMSLLAIWFPALVLFSVLGLICSFLAFRAMKQFPDEIQGKTLAMAGGVLSLVITVCAPAYHSYIYMTEVPDGYNRLNFAELKSKPNEPDVPPNDALQYDGQKIFIKGYIHPTSMDSSVSKKFVLVPDLGTCCFGAQPPITHMIEVSLQGEQYARKSWRKQRLAGTLRINRHMKAIDGLTGVYYQLKADVLK